MGYANRDHLTELAVAIDPIIRSMTHIPVQITIGRMEIISACFLVGGEGEAFKWVIIRIFFHSKMCNKTCILITLSGEIGQYKNVSKANWLAVKKTRVVFHRDSGTKGR